MAKSKKLSDFRQQAMNANKHTERGMKALEASMNEIGYTAPMIAAADGEIIAGSARHETAANVFGADVEPVVVESDGKRPIVVVRTDIKNAETREAKRIGLLDNRVQEMDLSFDPLVLAQLYAEDKTLTAGLWSDDELTELLNEAAGTAAGDGDAEPQIDKAAELNKIWQVKAGDLWQIGEHRLLCGDSTKREDVERVMMGEKADMAFTSPPYNAGKTPTESKSGADSKYTGYSDDLNDEQYLDLLVAFTQNTLIFAKFSFVNIQSLAGNKLALIDYLHRMKNWYADTLIWDKNKSQPAMANNVLNSQYEYVHIFEGEQDADLVHVFSANSSRAIGARRFRGTIANVVRIPNNHQSVIRGHAAAFPLAFATWFINLFSVAM